MTFSPWYPLHLKALAMLFHNMYFFTVGITKVKCFMFKQIFLISLWHWFYFTPMVKFPLGLQRACSMPAACTGHQPQSVQLSPPIFGHFWQINFSSVLSLYTYDYQFLQNTLEKKVFFLCPEVGVNFYYVTLTLGHSYTFTKQSFSLLTFSLRNWSLLRQNKRKSIWRVSNILNLQHVHMFKFNPQLRVAHRYHGIKYENMNTLNIQKFFNLLDG